MCIWVDTLRYKEAQYNTICKVVTVLHVEICKHFWRCRITHADSTERSTCRHCQHLLHKLCLQTLHIVKGAAPNHIMTCL